MSNADVLRASIRTLADRLATIERRLGEHDRQIAGLEDVAALHQATLIAFGEAVADIAALRKDLAQLSTDVAVELEA